MNDRIDKLLAKFRRVNDTQMQGLAIVNSRLRVEMVGFRNVDEHSIGILITPWCMNLLLLPGNDDWSEAEQGKLDCISLPSGDYEFTVCQDETLGAYLTAVLFRTMLDFPDQKTAKDIADETLLQMFIPPSRPQHTISRRSLFTTSPER